jgi:hypothetical protein
MSHHQSATESLELLSLARAQLSGLNVPNTLRNRVCAACFAVSHEHHRSLLTLLLIEPAAVASAYALVRPQFEAYARAMWLWRCATEAQVERFREAGRLTGMKAMMEALAKTPGFEAVDLMETYTNHWSFMCAYVHTGAQQVSRWSEGPMIEPKYSDAEIQQVIRFAEKVSVFTGIAMAVLADKPDAARHIAEKALALRENAA